MIETNAMANSVLAAGTSAARMVQLLFLIVLNASAFYALSCLGPLQETMRTSIPLSDNQIALLQGPALALPVILLGVPVGILIDRRNRARVVLVLVLIQFVGSVLTAIAPSFWILFAARCMVGFAAISLLVTGFSVLADLYEPAQRGRAKATLVVGQFAGRSAAFLLGGYMLGVQSGWEPWRLAMAVLSIPLALSMGLLMFMKEPGRTSTTPVDSRVGKSMAAFWSQRWLIMPLLIGDVMLETVLTAISIWSAPTLSRNFALSPAEIGGLMAIVLIIGGFFGPILGGVLADYCHRTGSTSRTMTVLTSLAFLSMFGSFFTFAPVAWVAVSLLTLFVVLLSAAVAMALTLFTILVPAEIRGLSLSILGMANVLFQYGLAPVAVSSLSVALGGTLMLGKALTIVCIGAAFVAFGSLLFGRRYLPRQTRAI